MSVPASSSTWQLGIVYRAVVFGRCEPGTGKAAFGRLVDDVMNQEPYRSARHVFWIVDNGPSHRGHRAAAELQARHRRIVIVHTPTYASWLNQIEILLFDYPAQRAQTK
jgi:hypothetical protein